MLPIDCIQCKHFKQLSQEKLQIGSVVFVLTVNYTNEKQLNLFCTKYPCLFPPKVCKTPAEIQHKPFAGLIWAVKAPFLFDLLVFKTFPCPITNSLRQAPNYRSGRRLPHGVTKNMDITRGAIENIFKSGNANNQPVVQVVDLKRISSGHGGTPGPPRYRLAISDGTHFQQAMIATQLNNIITDNQLQVNCLVRLLEIICNTVQDKRIVIILNVQVVKLMPNKIGNPVSIDIVMAGDGAANNGQPPQAQPPQNQYIAGSGGNNVGEQQNNSYSNGGMQSGGMNQNGFGGNQQQNGGGMGGFNNKPHIQNQNQNPNSFNNNNNAGSNMGGGKPGGFGGGNSWNAPSSRANPFSGGGSTAISKMGGTPGGIFRPINSINPYQNGWTIRGRCTFKGDLRKFQNSRGEGSVVSFELTDESGSIRITGFTQAAQRIVDTVHMNRIYRVSRGFLKQANERYNRSTSNFEMTLDQSSELEEVDDDGTVLQIKYNFTKIANLESVDVKGTCDVVGIVTNVGPLSEITLRSSGEQCARRTVTITDDSNSSVELTLWRSQAETFLTEDSVQSHPVLLVRNGIRGDFGGVSLNVSRMTTLDLNPTNVPEGNKLRAWFDSGGHNASAIQSMTAGAGGAGGGKITGARKSLVDAQVEDVEPVFSQAGTDMGGASQGLSGGGGANAMFVTRAMVTFVNTKNDLYYPGDPETKKKVVEQSPGMWMSESSGKQLTDQEIVWRYIVSMKVADHSASHWVSAFDEVGPALFGRSAGDLRQLKELDHTHYEHIIEDALCRPMLLKVTVKETMWRDARQIRYTVARAEPISFATEARTLLDEINAYGAL